MKIYKLLILIPIYLLIINLIFISNFQGIEENKSISNKGTETNVKLNDNVDISIQRNRWYGTIIENNQKKLYLFKIIPIPLGKNYNLIHLIFLSILSILIAINLIMNSIEKKFKKEIFISKRDLI